MCVEQAKVILEDARKRQEAVDAEKAPQKTAAGVDNGDTMANRAREEMCATRRELRSPQQGSGAYKKVCGTLAEQRNRFVHKNFKNGVIFWLHPCSTTGQ